MRQVSRLGSNLYKKLEGDSDVAAALSGPVGRVVALAGRGRTVEQAGNVGNNGLNGPDVQFRVDSKVDCVVQSENVSTV